MSVDAAAALRAAERMGDDAIRITIEVKPSEYARFLEEAREVAVITAQPQPEPTWRERVWTAPPATRMTTREVAEAVGMSVSWVHKQTQRPDDPIPHRQWPDRTLVFTVGEVRMWLERVQMVRVPASRPYLHRGTLT